MREFSIKKWTIVALVAILLVGTLLAFLFITGGLPGSMFEERKFQTQRPDFSFALGEVKLATGNIEKLIFAGAHLEGRILSEPVETADSFEFLVSFPAVNSGIVEAIVVLPKEEGRRVGLITADEGIIPDRVYRELVLVPEVTLLLQVGEPIQISIYLHEITDELRSEVASSEFCARNLELCFVFLDEIEGWYSNNLRFVEAVREGNALPDNFRIGAVQELVVFDDK